MRKNYTLKLVLAMLVVVLVSLVSFVGVYKGKNLLKDYSYGKDFCKRKVALYQVVEEEPQSTEQSEENESEEEASEESEKDVSSEEDATKENEEKSDSESTNEEEKVEEENKAEEKTELTPEQKKSNYKQAKDNISRRLTAMKSEEYDIRLDDETGNLVIEVPEYINSNYLGNIVSKGKVEIKNTNSNEVIVDGNCFKDASARIDSTTYSKPIIALSFKLTEDAKNKIVNANQTHKDSEDNEIEATFAIILDGSTLYSDKAATFVDSASKGEMKLTMGQNDEGQALEEDYENALAITSVIKCGEIPVEYEIKSVNMVDSSISIKTIVILAVMVGVALLMYASIKFKVKGILATISLVGFVATTLLVLRYTNVKITLFTILALAIVTIVNYIIIIQSLSNNQSFKKNFVKMINVLIPCIIIAIVFCCAPYLQLASFGMTIFWGLIVMFVYNSLVTRVFLEK